MKYLDRILQYSFRIRPVIDFANVSSLYFSPSTIRACVPSSILLLLRLLFHPAVSRPAVFRQAVCRPAVFCLFICRPVLFLGLFSLSYVSRSLPCWPLRCFVFVWPLIYSLVVTGVVWKHFGGEPLAGLVCSQVTVGLPFALLQSSVYLLSFSLFACSFLACLSFLFLCL